MRLPSRKVSNQPAKPEPLSMAEVWDRPVDFNRETRRRAGLLGRLWRWDPMAGAKGPVATPPRYVRRHYNERILTAPKTRRERRHRARILRAMA
jgi:hypothetical protein